MIKRIKTYLFNKKNNIKTCDLYISKSVSSILTENFEKGQFTLSDDINIKDIYIILLPSTLPFNKVNNIIVNNTNIKIQEGLINFGYYKFNNDVMFNSESISISLLNSDIGENSINSYAKYLTTLLNIDCVIITGKSKEYLLINNKKDRRIDKINKILNN